MEEAVRLREPNRKQMIMRGEDLDSLIGPEHVARAVWRMLDGLGLRRFLAPIKAREGGAGRGAAHSNNRVGRRAREGGERDLGQRGGGAGGGEGGGGGEGQRGEQGLEELEDMGAAKAQGKNHPQRKGEVRASTTDPEARVMKLGDGGFAPAYNLQFATDTESRIIVGVGATNSGVDSQQLEPMQDQIEQRTQATPRQHLADGGYLNFPALQHPAQGGIEVFSPPRQHRTYKINPLEVQPDDSPAIADWRRRMASAEGQAIYRERAATAETVNADLKTWRGLDRLVLRGITKVLIVATWSALTYNLMRAINMGWL